MLLFFLLFFLHQTQSCPLTDDYLSRCHCGILTNGESYIKCDENSLNEIPQFKRSFPYDELIISNNNIKLLNSSSFDNIKTIRRINLFENSLSFIDDNLLRLLGNYLEELTLTGDHQINSLEFLTRYPLKKLRILKLNQFNLTRINLSKTFSNMTKLEIVYLRSCQLTHIPIIDQIQKLNLENNFLSNRIFLSTSYSQVSLAENNITSIILQSNPNLISLNLSNNHLNDFYSLNNQINSLDLSSNQLISIDWNMLSENLTILNLDSNHFSQINLNFLPRNLRDLSIRKNFLKKIIFPKSNSSLSSLDLSSNQLITIEKNLLFQQLNSLNLNKNPLNCNCHLQWLKQLHNASSWTCSLPKYSPFLSAEFKCQSMLMPSVIAFNITFISSSLGTGLLIQWKLIDEYHTIDYIQISIEQPYRLSDKFSLNQTRVFILNDIQLNKRYHLCLILVHKYARDKYCRDIMTIKSISLLELKLEENEMIFNDREMKSNDFIENNFYLVLIACCVGGFLTFALILTCFYLCYQIHKYKYAEEPVYRKCSQQQQQQQQQRHYHCPHHQIIYNSENLSNSTDSSHMDSSLSTKHIYQTIDSQDYCPLQRQENHHLFHLWNESVK